MNCFPVVSRLFLSVLLFCVSLISFAQEDYLEPVISNENTDKNQSVIAETQRGLLRFESRDQRYRLWFNARAQIDGAYFFGEQLNPIGNGVMLRRAHFGARAFLGPCWYVELTVNFAGSKIDIKDVYLMYRFHDSESNIFDVGGVRFGNFKESFSLESMTSSMNLVFIERATVVNALAPSYHLGVQAFYNYKWLTGFAGIHFQNILSNRAVQTSQNANKNEGIDEGISYTGKLVAMPFYNQENFGLHIGGALSYRTPKTDADLPNSVHYSSYAGTQINRKQYLDTDIITDVHHSMLAGVELSGYYKGFKIQSEFIWNSVHRNNNLVTEKQNGFYVFGSAMLFGGYYTYNLGAAEYAQPTRGKNWGDLELAFRYDYMNMNGVNIMGGASESYTVGLNYHMSYNVKFALNYTYTNHDRYANANGTLYVGYGNNGDLTKDSSQVIVEKGKSGDDFGFISARLQYSF